MYPHNNFHSNLPPQLLLQQHHLHQQQQQQHEYGSGGGMGMGMGMGAGGGMMGMGMAGTTPRALPSNYSSSNPMDMVPRWFEMLKELRNGTVSYIQLIKREQVRPPVRPVCRRLGVAKLSDIVSEEILYRAVVQVAEAQSRNPRKDDQAEGRGGGQGMQGMHNPGFGGYGQPLRGGPGGSGGSGSGTARSYDSFAGQYDADGFDLSEEYDHSQGPNNFSLGSGGSVGSNVNVNSLPNSARLDALPLPNSARLYHSEKMMPTHGSEYNLGGSGISHSHSHLGSHGGAGAHGGGFVGLLRALLAIRAADGRVPRMDQLARDTGIVLSEDVLMSALQGVCNLLECYRLTPAVSQEAIARALTLHMEGDAARGHGHSHSHSHGHGSSGDGGLLLRVDSGGYSEASFGRLPSQSQSQSQPSLSPGAGMALGFGGLSPLNSSRSVGSGAGAPSWDSNRSGRGFDALDGTYVDDTGLVGGMGANSNSNMGGYPDGPHHFNSHLQQQQQPHRTNDLKRVNQQQQHMQMMRQDQLSRQFPSQRPEYQRTNDQQHQLHRLDSYAQRQQQVAVDQLQAGSIVLGPSVPVSAAGQGLLRAGADSFNLLSGGSLGGDFGGVGGAGVGGAASLNVQSKSFVPQVAPSLVPGAAGVGMMSAGKSFWDAAHEAFACLLDAERPLDDPFRALVDLADVVDAGAGAGAGQGQAAGQAPSLALLFALDNVVARAVRLLVDRPFAVYASRLRALDDVPPVGETDEAAGTGADAGASSGAVEGSEVPSGAPSGLAGHGQLILWGDCLGYLVHVALPVLERHGAGLDLQTPRLLRHLWVLRDSLATSQGVALSALYAQGTGTGKALDAALRSPAVKTLRSLGDLEMAEDSPVHAARALPAHSCFLAVSPAYVEGVAGELESEEGADGVGALVRRLVASQLAPPGWADVTEHISFRLGMLLHEMPGMEAAEAAVCGSAALHMCDSCHEVDVALRVPANAGAGAGGVAGSGSDGGAAATAHDPQAALAAAEAHPALAPVLHTEALLHHLRAAVADTRRDIAAHIQRLRGPAGVAPGDESADQYLLAHARKMAKLNADAELMCKIGDRAWEAVAKGLSARATGAGEAWTAVVGLRAQVQTAREEVRSGHRQRVAAVAGALGQAGYSGMREEVRFCGSVMGGSGLSGVGGVDVLHFVDEDAPTGPTPCSLVVADDQSDPSLQTALLAAYIALHPHVHDLVVLVRAFAREHSLVCSGGCAGLLSSYAWCVLAVHFLLHRLLVPNIHEVAPPAPAAAATAEAEAESVVSASASPAETVEARRAHLSDRPAQAAAMAAGGYAARLEETSVLALLKDFFEYLVSADTLGTTLTLRGQGAVLPKGQAFPAPSATALSLSTSTAETTPPCWRLSLEDPWCPSSHPCDLGATLSLGEQLRTFRTVGKAAVVCAAALKGCSDVPGSASVSEGATTPEAADSATVPAGKSGLALSDVPRMFDRADQTLTSLVSNAGYKHQPVRTTAEALVEADAWRYPWRLKALTARQLAAAVAVTRSGLPASQGGAGKDPFRTTATTASAAQSNSVSFSVDVSPMVSPRLQTPRLPTHPEDDADVKIHGSRPFVPQIPLSSIGLGGVGVDLSAFANYSGGSADFSASLSSSRTESINLSSRGVGSTAERGGDLSMSARGRDGLSAGTFGAVGGAGGAGAVGGAVGGVTGPVGAVGGVGAIGLGKGFYGASSLTLTSRSGDSYGSFGAALGQAALPVPGLGDDQFAAYLQEQKQQSPQQQMPMQMQMPIQPQAQRAPLGQTAPWLYTGGDPGSGPGAGPGSGAEYR